ncbi:MAG: hypothetical protein EBR82_70755 [Caulobacteraceae bacterium]|nr:hypothetical protein [Caulobacteraceae bacterium]
MSDGMTEAYRRHPITKKVNKNVSIDIDKKNKAIRIMNNLNNEDGVEIKLKTLEKIVEIVNETMKGSKNE